MKYINVFDNESSFNDVSNNLETSQLAYISDTDKIFCLSIVPEPEVEVVDLGLSVKWAKYNIGASAVSPYGNLYAWGEIETKTDYSWSTYKYCDGTETTLTKYNNNSAYGAVDNKMELEREDDIAYINQYHKLRIPTYEECCELRDTNKITCEWSNDCDGLGTPGCIFTSKVEGYVGNSIFIPAAGFYNGTTHVGIGVFGGIWTSTVRQLLTSYAYSITILSSGASDTYNGKFNGTSVRGVQDK